MMKHPIRQIAERHWEAGMPAGIPAVCSANSFVIEAAVQQAVEDDTPLLVEATSNQVDQFGGYTGMKPRDFAEFVRRIAIRRGLPPERLILGGDHLGPNVWRHLEPEVAMKNAREQIAAYVEAGFTKIHLDASMPLKGDRADSHLPLDVELVARRSAELCLAAEEAASRLPQNNLRPVYVIGTDVPIPGGATDSLRHLRITPVEEVQETLRQTKKAFLKNGLQDAWQRVIAVVVQPGVEFSDEAVADYQPELAAPLSRFIETQDGLIYEAHSTDYQTAGSLRKMVQDHFAILKVGPALTFALREALFALTFIEDELLQLHGQNTSSRLRTRLEEAMKHQPEFWEKYYRGTPRQQAFARKYAFSDRIRYYWPQKSVRESVEKLFENLRNCEIPFTLLSQFLPNQYHAVRQRKIENSARALVLHKIQEVLKAYAWATGTEMIHFHETVSPIAETM